MVQTTRLKAIEQGSTQYTKTVTPPGISHVTGQPTRMLKRAADNAKLGGGRTVRTWQRGPFKGLPLYSLTLEERATCDRSCPVWDLCYGDHMPFASRFDATLDEGRPLMRLLEQELCDLDNRHPEGYSVRLHVLGDFFSLRYVVFWRRSLRRHPGLRAYGYTHRTGALSRAIDKVFMEFPGRFVLMQSDPTEETVRPLLP